MEQHVRFETRMFGAFAAAVLVVVALAATTWEVARRADEASRWVAHTHEVLDSIADVRANTLAIELITQSYRISGDAAHLADRDADIAAREASLQRIKTLTADNERQRDRWRRLREATDQRLAISNHVVLLRQTQGLAAMNAYLASVPLRVTRKRVSSLLGEMEAEERRLLVERSVDQARARQGVVLAGALAALALVALLTATLVVIRRQLRATEASRQALAKSEENLSITLHSIGDAVLVTDAKGCITRMNPVAERLTGWPFAQAQGRAVDEVFRIVNEQSRAPAVVPVAAVLASGQVQGLANHTVLIARDGTECPIADSAAPIREAGGRVCGVVLVFRDASVERQVERVIRDQNQVLEQHVLERTARLRQSEEQQRLIVESATDYAIVMLDPDGRIATWNLGAERIKGYTALEIIGQHFACFYPAADIASGKPGAELAIAARDGRFEEEGWRVRKNGAAFWANVVMTPARDPAGVLRGFVKITRDISERKLAQQAIHELNASLELRVAARTLQLEEASRAKSDFLANMSHELRTPLNAIIGFSEMLKDGLLGELDGKQRGFITDIFDAGSHLLALINDVLDLSKVEAGALQLDAAAVDLPALFQASMLVVREKAHAHRIGLDVRLDPALGTMLADARKLKQIVYNLLSNAVKFTPEGGRVTLHVRRCARAEVGFDATLPARLIALPPGAHDEFLAITVQDTGLGIAEENLPKLFEPFMQIDSSMARLHSGTGLGLSLVRRLAELHGGAVGAASHPGAGSRFCVWLPYYAVTPNPPIAYALASAPAASGTAVPAVPLALVIEDDDRMADLIAAQLRSEGFEVMRAATAEEGLVRAAKHRLQLITLDIFLPAMDGWEFMRRLAADPKLADTPVVIITGSADLDRAQALGALRVLQKPFRSEELVAALAGLVDARPNGAPLRVLVVDDNVQAIELVTTILEAEGYFVLRAYGGAEAIRVARSALPDLMILDLLMPQVSGFEVALALRESEDTARIPIVVLTAKDLSAEDKARLHGAVSATLAKASFSRGGLLAELRRAMSGRASH